MTDKRAENTQDLHTALDAYIQERYGPSDSLLQELLDTARQEGLPPIQVPPALGHLLSMLIHIAGVRRVLEIGTLAGYSTIWMARALPEGGRLVSLEVEPRHAALAIRFLARAGLAQRVDVRIGPALESLASLVEEPPFDLVFIDADTLSLPAYLDWALRLTRAGGLILADNVLRGVLEPGSPSAQVEAMRTYNDRVAQDPRLEAIILLTRDGLEGLSLARVRETTHPVA